MPDTPSNEAFARAKASFVAGLESLKAGEAAAAEAHFLASLEQVPGRVSTLVNLAATRLQLGKFSEALEAADAVLKTEPDNTDGWWHRATALGGLRRLEEAASAFERLLGLDDTQPEYWLRHAQTAHALQRHSLALTAYERALALRPAMPGAWSRYGDLLREEHRPADAARAFERALEHGGDPQLNGYMLAAVSQRPPPGTAPHSYVRALFDGYAEDFDRHLVDTLGYQAHTVLVSRLAGLAGAPWRRALDLGCGTGLCGPLLRPLCQRLVGIDLSQAMLDKAAALRTYDALIQADVVDHLRATTETHDVVVAADVLIYVGELAPLFRAVHRACEPGALFGFSVELPSRAAVDFELMPSLRYAHSEAHVRQAAAAHGFSVSAAWREPLRRDQRVPVDGLYVCLRRE